MKKEAQSIDGGYIKIFRKIRGNPLYKNSTALHCWLECLLKASHKVHTVQVGRQRIDLQPGQFVFGRHTFADNLGISGSTVWYWISIFKADRLIDIKKTTKYSIITIRNWELYQGDMTGRATTEKQQKNTYKNVKNIISIAEDSADRDFNEAEASSAEEVEPWNFEDYREKLRSSKQRHMQVIGLWWLIRGYTFPSKAAAAADIKRWLRVAQSLAAWTDADITNTANWLRDQELSYTLETIGKHIVERRNYRGNGGATAPGEAERTTGKSTAQLDFERKGWDWGRYVAGDGYWRIDGTKV